ncbi:MAG: hypothetical protein R3321_14565 [Nitrososphaeraceae archaeon]|nr:hypothetical protein [Nitrososphaeraceae archaeon]
MRDYTIHYKDGHTEEIEVAGKKELIDKLFNGDEDKFKSEVVMLRWQSSNMFFTEDVTKGTINSEITTADANPYGWRNEGNKPH